MTPTLRCRYSTATIAAPMASSMRPRSSTPLLRRKTSCTTIPPCTPNSTPPRATRTSACSMKTAEPAAASPTGASARQEGRGLQKNKQTATNARAYEPANSTLPNTTSNGESPTMCPCTTNSGKASASMSKLLPQCARPSSFQRPKATIRMASAMDSATTGNISSSVDISTGIGLPMAGLLCRPMNIRPIMRWTPGRPIFHNVGMTHPLSTRFTRRFGLSTPMALAPMALASGGALAAACARAGALGLVGGGYGDLAWTQREYRLALEAVDTGRIGCGFITWKLDEDASALDWVLDLPPEHRPRAVMLSFGDARRYAARISAGGAALICQIQRMDQAAKAVEAGAAVLVAQGAEAGGHSMDSLNGRATLTFVPELADCLAPQGAKDVALATNGDGTARTAIFDILRRKNWPAPYDFRAIRNRLHRQWEGRVDALRAQPEEARARYDAGWQEGDFEAAHVTVGEGGGLVHDLPDAQTVIERMHLEASTTLARHQTTPDFPPNRNG